MQPAHIAVRTRHASSLSGADCHDVGAAVLSSRRRPQVFGCWAVGSTYNASWLFGALCPSLGPPRIVSVRPDPSGSSESCDLLPLTTFNSRCPPAVKRSHVGSM